jgi:hypothetical protein
MPGMMSKEPSFWWPIPLALLLWLALLWGVGFILKPPLIESPPAAPMDARLVELVEDQPTQKSAQAAVVVSKPKATATPKLRTPKLTPPRPKAKPQNPNPPEPAQSVPQPTPPLNLARPTEAAPTDMMSYVNAARARRQAEEAAAGNAQQPSADDIRMANIRRNLQPDGTNGIFQILDIQARTARFSFRSWTTNASNPQRETITVSSGSDGDIELAIVRRMIGLIRNYFKGDFNWESQRLGQVVVLSAREEDTAELEDFLKREFFGVGVKNRSH